MSIEDLEFLENFFKTKDILEANKNGYIASKNKYQKHFCVIIFSNLTK